MDAKIVNNTADTDVLRPARHMPPSRLHRKRDPERREHHSGCDDGTTGPYRSPLPKAEDEAGASNQPKRNPIVVRRRSVESPSKPDSAAAPTAPTSNAIARAGVPIESPPWLVRKRTAP